MEINIKLLTPLVVIVLAATLTLIVFNSDVNDNNPISGGEISYELFQNTGAVTGDGGESNGKTNSGSDEGTSSSGPDESRNNDGSDGVSEPNKPDEPDELDEPDVRNDEDEKDVSVGDVVDSADDPENTGTDDKKSDNNKGSDDGLSSGGNDEEEIIIEKPENITATISIEPSLELYEPGDRLNAISVRVKGTKSGLIKGLNLSGILETRNPINLTFSEINKGEYRYDIDYVIPKDENRLIPIRVEGSFEERNINVSEYLLVDTEEYFGMKLNSPTKSDVALGQEVLFEVEMYPRSINDEINVLETMLVEVEGGERLLMSGDDFIYTKEFIIPKTIAESTRVLVWSKATVNGVERDNVKEVDLEKNPELYIGFDRRKQNVDDGTLALDVRYIDANGGSINTSGAMATIISYPSLRTQNISLEEEEDVLIGKYLKESGENSAEIEITDGFGNLGRAVLPSEFFATTIEIPEDEPVEFPWAIIVLIVVVGVILAFGLATVTYSKKSALAGLNKMKARQKELKSLIKRTKLDFYKKRVGADVANKRITEYEEELKLISEKLKKN